MLQFSLAIFGLTALWMATGRNERARLWAPVVGLLGQPAWLAFAWQAQAWGLFVLSLAYTAVYVRAAWRPGDRESFHVFSLLGVYWAKRYRAPGSMWYAHIAGRIYVRKPWVPSVNPRPASPGPSQPA